MKTVVRAPISPSPNYLNRSILLARSLRKLDSALSSAEIEVYVSPDRDPAPTEWYEAVRSEGIRWIDVNPEEFSRYGYTAATHQRFLQPTDAEVILQVDADLVFVRPFDEVIDRCWRTQSVLGVPAYRTPFTRKTYSRAAELSPRSCWAVLFQQLGLPSPEFTSTHPSGFESGWDSEICSAPAYFNYGVLFVPAGLAPSLGASLGPELEHIDALYTGDHRAQLALTAALVRLGIRAAELPLQYNFPNQAGYLPHFSGAAEDIRILHYMNRRSFDKEHDLNSTKLMRDWLGNAQDHLHQVLARIVQRELTTLDAMPWNT